LISILNRSTEDIQVNAFWLSNHSI
jgi:hypothetical protein